MKGFAIFKMTGAGSKRVALRLDCITSVAEVDDHNTEITTNDEHGAIRVVGSFERVFGLIKDGLIAEEVM